MARMHIKRVLVITFFVVVVILAVALFHGGHTKPGTTYEVLPQKRLPLKLDAETEEEKDEERKGFTNNGFNQFVSDRLPLDREIPDTRDPK